MRSITRITGVGINTVNRLLVNAGTVCQEYHDKTMRDVDVEYLQADELWSFIYARQKNAHNAIGVIDAVGDSWTWTAIDPDTKLMVSWLVGDRTLDSATEFMEDIHSRVKGRINLSTDGHQPYVRAVDSTFGSLIDYGQVVKNYRLKGAKKETLEEMKEDFIRKVTVSGEPEIENIGTSHVERQNLSIRMGLRRFTRKTNAHSKKLDNHRHALALYFTYYNFVREHSSLGMTPAMAAGVVDDQYSLEWIVDMVNEMIKPKKRGRYKRRRK